jgi:hypothetical protein
MLWICKSADMVIGYLPTLERTLRALHVSLYPADGPPRPGCAHGLFAEGFRFLRVRIHCTEKDPRRRAALRAELAGSILEHMVLFERPDLEEVVAAAMEQKLASGMTAYGAIASRTQVTFCGSAAVGGLCYEAVLRANKFAEGVGCPEISFRFREENYGYMGKPPASPLQEQGGAQRAAAAP